MKRTKKLYILLGVLVVICIATFALSKTEEKKENIKNSDKTVLEVDSDSVNKISWKSSLGSLAFEKKDGTWTYTDDANLRYIIKMTNIRKKKLKYIDMMERIVL